GDDREILSRRELLEAFTLARIGASGSVFDVDKLRWVNAHYLHHATGAELRAWIERELDAGDAPPPRWAAEWRSLGQGSAREAMARELFQPVRAALTGRTHGPELPMLAEFLQRDRCIERLRRAAAKGSESS